MMQPKQQQQQQDPKHQQQQLPQMERWMELRSLRSQLTEGLAAENDSLLELQSLKNVKTLKSR